MHYIRRVRYDAFHMRVFLGLFTAYFALFIPLALSQNVRETGTQNWPAYGGGPANIHYSPLARINRTNVKRLQVAWSFDTGEQGGLQTSPIIVGGVLYGITPTQKVFALNAATGKLLWKFDSGIKGTQPPRPASSSGNSTPASRARSPIVAWRIGPVRKTSASSPVS